MSIMEGMKELDSFAEAIVQGEAALSVSVERCVFPRDFDGCRGLCANKDVSAGDLLLKVPLECTLSPSRAKEKLGASAVAGLSDQDCLILGLVADRALGKQSPVASYIESLPTSEEIDSTLFWTPDELEKLQGQSKVRATALNSAMEAASRKFAATRLDGALPEVSDVDYRWARGILNSRQFNLTEEDGLLVPGVDLFNHDASIGSTCMSIEGDFVVARAARSYKANEQIFINYGQASNAELLVSKGFVVVDNPLENVELFLELGTLPGDLQAAALAIATAAGCSVEDANAQCKIKCSDPLPSYLVELAQTCAGGSLEEGLSTLLQQFGKMLEQYPTSASENKELLQSKLTWRIRCAVVARAGEQQVLLNAIDNIVNRLVRLLSNSKLPQEGLEQRGQAVVEKYSAFAQLPACREVQAHWATFATAAFLALYGKLHHTCATSVLEAAAKAPVETIFGQRMAFWGSYLLAQFCVTGSLDRSQATTMLMESTDLRNSLGWSIPTNDAIEIIKSELPQPIKVLGSPESASPWVEALKGAGVQVDSGSESAKSWVVVWPDPGGSGNAGLEAVEAFEASQAEVLVCIGEWQGSTLGLAQGDARTGGQAFSTAAQAMVTSKFTLQTTVQMPSWPLACDRLGVYRRSP